MPSSRRNDENPTDPTPKKRARKPGPLTEAQRKRAQGQYLSAYAQDGNKTVACEAAGIHRSTLYEWLEHDEAFSLRAHQAEEMANDALRAEIKRRAVDGWDEPVYQLGKYAGLVRKYSDTLLIFHAKARMPEYRDKAALEVTGKDGGPIEVGHVKQQLATKLADLARRARPAESAGGTE